MMPHVSDEIKNTIGRALGRIPSGVYVVTAEHNGRSWAMLASWVQQASFDPPAISVAIGPDRPIAELIKLSRRFALTVIPEGDHTLMRRYARGVKMHEDPFAGMNTLTAPSGLRVFADGLAWLDCQLLQVTSFGADHELFVGKVVAGRLLKEAGAFMHQRGSGFHY